MKFPLVRLKQIYTFRVGEEIELSKAQSLIFRQTTDTFKIKKYSRDLIMEEAPIIVILPSWNFEYNGKSYVIESSAKIWSFGAISIGAIVDIKNEDTNFISAFLNLVEENEEFYKVSLDKVTGLVENINPCISGLEIWPVAEDYNVIQISNENADLEACKNDLYSIIEGSSAIPLSNQIKDGLRSASYQYSENDLVIMDWNRSLAFGDVIEVEELTDILEFALCQMLVLRFYDDLLDKKLNTLYKSIRKSEGHFFKNNFSTLAKESALLYIDFSYILESITNSFKFIGDTYYAKIYRASMDRFRIKDWHSTVHVKLGNLADLSKMFSGEVNEKRNQLMELVIVILITIEVIPFLFELFIKYK